MYPPTPGNSYGYQKKGVTKIDCWKLLKTKGTQSRRQNAESRKEKGKRGGKVAGGALSGLARPFEAPLEARGKQGAIESRIHIHDNT